MNRFDPDTSKNRNPDCFEFVTKAEQELSAFFGAVKELFGPEQAELSANDWLRELNAIEGLPASAGEWRRITAMATARLAGRVPSSSLSTEAQMV
jgi:hypothetical protein